jgi:hypothetical protein
MPIPLASHTIIKVLKKSGKTSNVASCNIPSFQIQKSACIHTHHCIFGNKLGFKFFQRKVSILKLGKLPVHCNGT